MADLLRVKIGTIYSRLQKRTMQPPPGAWQRPYLWNRDVVRRYFERDANEGPPSRYFRKARERRRREPIEYDEG